MIEETLCPLCSGKMTSRMNRSTGQRFWGCNQYPKCKGTRDTDGNANRGIESGDSHGDDDRMPSERRRGYDTGRWRNQ